MRGRDYLAEYGLPVHDPDNRAVHPEWKKGHADRMRGKRLPDTAHRLPMERAGRRYLYGYAYAEDTLTCRGAPDSVLRALAATQSRAGARDVGAADG